MHALNNLYETYKNDIEIIAVSMNYSQGASQNYYYQFPYFTWVENDGVLTTLFEAEGSPTIAFIDREGVYCENLRGASSVESCQSNIVNTLNRYLVKEIKKTDISTASIKVLGSNFVFNNKAIKPEVEVRLGDTLISKDNYVVKYEGNFNAGDAKITVTAVGDLYEGSCTTTFKIGMGTNKISNLKVKNNRFYAESLYGEVKFKYFNNLTPDEYLTGFPIKPGNYTVIAYVDGNSNYKYTESRLEFKLDKLSIEESDIVISNNNSTYTGEKINPNIVINDGDKELINNKDYKVTLPNDLINAGTKDIVIEGTGDYEFSYTIKFTISRAENVITSFKKDNDSFIVNSLFDSDKAVIRYFKDKDCTIEVKDLNGLDKYYAKAFIIILLENLVQLKLLLNR